MARRINLTRLIAIMSYWTGIDSLFYWLNRKAKKVLTFHNVLPDALAPLDKGVSDSESSFRRIVREVGKRFGFSTDIDDPKTVTITFDDGYLNQYEVAARVLQEEGGIPAILFVSGRAVRAREPKEVLVVDQLTHWVDHAPGVARSAWVKEVRPRYVRDSKTRGEGLLASLDRKYPLDDVWRKLPGEYRRLRLTGIPTEKLVELHDRGWKIGWHTESHYPLAELSEEELHQELRKPSCIPVEIQSDYLSYPYGELKSVNADAVRVAREEGWAAAFANILEPNALTSRHFLPRTFVPMDKYMLHFVLSGAKQFMQKRKLFPVVQVVR